jgi:hypothetical protein
VAALDRVDVDGVEIPRVQFVERGWDIGVSQRITLIGERGGETKRGTTSLKICYNQVSLRIVLLEVDRVNVDENLQLVLHKDISSLDRDVAVRSPILVNCDWMRRRKTNLVHSRKSFNDKVVWGVGNRVLSWFETRVREESLLDLVTRE